jgi:hypothetical protein
VVLGFKLRASCLQSTCSAVHSGSFGDGGLKNYLSGLASNLSPDASFPSRQDYRHEPPAPGFALLKRN